MPSQGSQPLRRPYPLLTAIIFLSEAVPAFAHASERGQVMLLPTHLFILGGALAVAVSVIASAAIPVLFKSRRFSTMLRLPDLSWPLPALMSLCALVVVLLLIAAGLWGPADPISNPLPGAVWTLWWVGLTWATMLFGNLWASINPWTGIFELVRRAGWRPPFQLPLRICQWAAVLLFFAFAWFELVYPAPSDPQRLASVVFVYLTFTFVMLLLLGEAWLKTGECFSVYFRIVSLLSPLQWEGVSRRLTMGIPGFAMLEEKTLGNALAALVILALTAVSFDGFSRTFFWVSGQGLNPLEFPGRSAVAVANTFAFAVMFVSMASIVRNAITAGSLLTGTPPLPQLVLAMVPIAFAYHVAHYLPEFPIAIMQFAKALAATWGGGESIHPPASIMMDHGTATLVFTLQTTIIVLGHVTAVIIAHLMALRTMPARSAVISQLPLNTVMVLYTVFGLWLLSTPVIS